MTLNRKLILWDLDGALCPHNESFRNLAPQAVAAAALDFHIPIGPDEALDFARQNFKGQRPCILAFVNRFQLDEVQFFERYYHHLSPDFIVSSPKLIEAFGALPTQCSSGIFTQAPCSWAHKALKQLALESFFSESHIIGYEQLAGARKADAQGRARLTGILQDQGYSAATTALIDDKLEVLLKLKPHISRCVWIQDRPSVSPAPPDVPLVLSRLEAFAALEDFIT